MDQKTILGLTEIILSINDNPEEVYEFICALSNAKAFLENKLTAQAYKTASTMQMKSIMAMIVDNHHRGD